MPAIPYAFSVHHFISSVGADAGFAAIIGLALVTLLFFAHARETRNLRERAEDAEDALQRLELYVDQIARAASAGRQSPTPAPAVVVARQTPAPAGVVMAGVSAGVVMAGAPAAPAGVGAPALSAATRLIPIPDGDAIAIHATGSGTAAATVPAGQTAAAVMDPPAAVMDPPAPGPSTTAGGAINGSGAGRVAPPPAFGAGRERAAVAPIGSRAASVPDSPRRRQSRGGRSRIGRGALALATVLLVAGLVVALLVLTKSSGSGDKTASSTHSARARHPAARRHGRSSTASTASVKPSTVTVAVLNGTSTNNLAHDISQKLTTAGYRPGRIATASAETQSTTVVGYLPNDKRDAIAVAKSLKLGAASVQAVDASSQTVACNGSSTACSAQVVVTVGADLASSA